MSLEYKVQGSGVRVQGPGFRVQGSGFRVQGPGFGVWGGDQDEVQAAEAHALF